MKPALLPLRSEMRKGIIIDSFLLVSLIGTFFAFPFGTLHPARAQATFPVTIRDGNLEFKTFTDATTVESALTTLEIGYTNNDIVTPPISTQLTFGSTIIITRSSAIHVNDGGKESEYETQVTTVGDLLKEKNITLNAKDTLEPNPATLLVPAMTIAITRITEKDLSEQKEIPFETVEKNDGSVLRGETKVTQEGKNGQKTQNFHVTYKNGKEIQRDLSSEKIDSKPTNKVVSIGTKLLFGKSLSGRATWYSYKGGMTCAARDWPKGSRLLVTSRTTGRSVEVEVNDYGPTAGSGNLIDLDRDAFEVLGSLGTGVLNVTVKQILN